MTALRQNAFSKLPLAVVAPVVLAGLAGWWSWSSYGRAERAARRLLAAERTWQALRLSDPVPTETEARSWQEQRSDLETEVAAARRELGVGREDPVTRVPVPAQRAEAFFALAQFGENQLAKAKAAGVAVPPGTAFGFSAYANSGPDDAELAVVHAQHQVAKVLLETLWSCGARELTRLQREAPATKLTPTAVARRREGRTEDILEWPAVRSLTRPGLVRGLALRIGFIGKTADLRRYLAALAQQSLPLVVRAVEVERLGVDGAARGGVRTLADLFRDEDEDTAVSAAANDAPVPIIAANDAEFLVTVEYLDFTAAAAKTEALQP